MQQNGHCGIVNQTWLAPRGQTIKEDACLYKPDRNLMQVINAHHILGREKHLEQELTSYEGHSSRSARARKMFVQCEHNWRICGTASRPAPKQDLKNRNTFTEGRPGEIFIPGLVNLVDRRMDKKDLPLNT